MRKQGVPEEFGAEREFAGGAREAWRAGRGEEVVCEGEAFAGFGEDVVAVAVEHRHALAVGVGIGPDAVRAAHGRDTVLELQRLADPLRGRLLAGNGERDAVHRGVEGACERADDRP